VQQRRAAATALGRWVRWRAGAAAAQLLCSCHCCCTQNIDTDQIIPAEYLTLVPSKVGVGVGGQPPSCGGHSRQLLPVEAAAASQACMCCSGLLSLCLQRRCEAEVEQSARCTRMLARQLPSLAATDGGSLAGWWFPHHRLVASSAFHSTCSHDAHANTTTRSLMSMRSWAATHSSACLTSSTLQSGWVVVWWLAWLVGWLAGLAGLAGWLVGWLGAAC
jgi:hypothetical protein